MNLDPAMLKKLLETFQAELEELLQVITNGLLELESKQTQEDHSNTINNLFRAAHTIKGSSRSLGINTIGEIAHRIESLFSKLQKQSLQPSTQLIDLILDAVDKIKIAMDCYKQNSPLSFELDHLLSLLENFNPAQSSKLPQQNNIQTQRKDKPIQNQDTIHVSVKEIDKISAIMEDIQTNKIAMKDHYSELSKMIIMINDFSKNYKKNPQDIHYINDFITNLQNDTHNLSSNMLNNINDISISFNSLQDEISELRLMPADTLLQRYPRYVRELAHELDKQVELTLSGDDVKLDKLLLEALNHPILHLLRNAVDHGIETIPERKNKNKPDVGNIKIDILEEGNHVTLIVKDDGRGIDLEKIKQIALKNHLSTPHEIESMNASSLLDFIFTPGFSTKDSVTDLSGRGFGLDIVKTNLNRIKGLVSVTSEKDGGTTFSIKIPRTITGERGLIVGINNQNFIIPSLDITKILTIQPDQIIDVNQSQVILNQQEPIPLFSLANLLNLKKIGSYSQDQFLIVIISRNSHQIALQVDEIKEEREIIIKPLQTFLANVTCVEGGSLYANNEVIFVLNPEELIKKALHLGNNDRIVVEKQNHATIEKPRILLVDDSITTRTLEKNILESKNYHVTVAVNGKEAWDLLQKYPFSLLITDINMPIMDGITLTEKVKQNEKLRNLPVIIVTSLGSEEEKKRGINSGADAYIIKSEFESGTLLEVVSQWV